MRHGWLALRLGRLAQEKALPRAPEHLGGRTNIIRGPRRRKPGGGKVPTDKLTGPVLAGARERGFLDAALDCVIMIDAEDRVVEFNPSAEKTFGYLREDAVGRTLPELIIPPSLRNRHEQALDRFLRTREKRLFGQRVELTAMRADGTEFPVELTLSLVEGEPLLVYGAVRDLSQDKETKRSLQVLVDEQAALRRVATLVAGGAGPTEVFAAVAEGVARVLEVPGINMIRFDDHATGTKVAGWGSAPLDIGAHWDLADPSVMALVANTGRPARIDDYATLKGPFAKTVMEAGIRSGVGAPIVVDGEPWGVIVAFSPGSRPLSDDAEDRLAKFTELVATAVSNVQARDSLQELVNEQGALKRVATLAARSSDPYEIFDAVCQETGELVGGSRVAVEKHMPGGVAQIVSEWVNGEKRASGGPEASSGTAAANGHIRGALGPVTDFRTWSGVTSTGRDPARSPRWSSTMRFGARW